MQPELFTTTPKPTPAPRRKTEQRVQLARVQRGIGALVLEFVRRVGVGKTFHGDELSSWIAARTKVAPGSSDRILRELRRAGQLNYSVLSRSQSLYRVEAVWKPGK